MLKISSLSIGLIVGIVGLVLVLLGQLDIDALGIDISAVIRSVGTFLISAAFLGFLYEVHTKHQFFLEAHNMALGTEKLALAGLCDFEENSKKVDFSQDIRNSREIWTFFSYSSRFIDDYSDDIRSALSNGARINMIFLDRDSKALTLMNELGWHDDTISASYRKIANFKEHSNNDKLQIVYAEALPKYSAVIIDDKLFYIFNTLSLERQQVPCLTAKKGQSLFNFILNDIRSTFHKSGGE